MYRILLSVLFSLLLALPVRAEEKPTETQDGTHDKGAEETAQALEMEAWVVTPDRAERQEFLSSRSVDVIPEKEIVRKQAKAMPDLLEESAGVHVQRTNAGSGAPIMRGQIGPDNLIMVDGVRFNNSTFRTGPNQYLSLIDPNMVRQIEVLRGPGSVLYGSDALGGVMQVLTRDPRALGERSWGLDGSLGFASAWLGLSANANGDFEEGPYRGYLGASFGLFDEVTAGGGDVQPLSDYWRSNARHKSVYALGDGMKLTWALFETTIRGAGRAERVNQARHRNYDNDDMLTYVQFDRINESWLRKITVNLSYHLTNEVEGGVRCPEDDNGVVIDREACLAAQLADLTKRYEKHDTVNTVGYFATAEARLWDERISLLLGTEGYFDFVSSSARQSMPDDWSWNEDDRGNFSDGSRYSSLGLFLRGDARLLDVGQGYFGLNGGVRLSHFAASAPDVPGLGDVDYNNTGLVGNGGVHYVHPELVNLYVDFSQGFRAPNLQETTVLGDTGATFETPNTDLDPVRSDTVEVGMKLKTDLFRLHGAGYFSRIDGAFEREELTQEEWQALGITNEMKGETDVVRRINASEALYRGVEAGLSTTPLGGVSLWANIGWTQGDVELPDGTTEPARRVPPLSGAAGLRYEHAGWGFYADLYTKWATAQTRLNSGDEGDLRICEDPDNPGMLLADCTGTAGWATINLRAGFSLNEYLDFRLALENLSDEHYKYHGSGLYAPGFNGMLQVAVKY